MNEDPFFAFMRRLIAVGLLIGGLMILDSTEALKRTLLSVVPEDATFAAPLKFSVCDRF